MIYFSEPYATLHEEAEARAKQELLFKYQLVQGLIDQIEDVLEDDDLSI